ncbi:MULTISPECIES: hydrogenase expression/formation protein HypE [unclassified Helicobacter]|uniref:hydrogenase expression/formation protein HypE n=1 Tax=unclassified Helicobacter TaxID=2593540 RepID=UPI000CF0C6F6|nr:MULTISPECIES: hydrogenase expression/formation protein HypE [unclassified Helicobacter]
MQTIQIAHGSGGAQTNELIEKIFLKYLGSFFVSQGEDGGVFDANSKKYVVSTDSFVVSPLFFSGGDIGKLSICGSSNDVVMMGAIPRFVTLGFIMEEGLEISVLEKILESMQKELAQTNLKILSADTKVVGKGSVDKIFINTTAIGEVICDISIQNLQEEDVIILSSDIGNHGSVIFCERNDLGITSNIQSDCKQLYGLLENILKNNEIKIHTIRDATRGGLASVLNEWAQSSQMDILIQEEAIRISNEVRGICEILGLEAYALANEGVCVIALPQRYANQVLEMLQSHSDGKNASIIGKVIQKQTQFPRVILQNAWGSKRFLDLPQGELLPRIC